MSTTGKKDETVIRERRYFLDLFLKECASLRYLAQSKELQIFLRPQGDLNQLMQKSYKPKLLDILATYRATLPVVEVSCFVWQESKQIIAAILTHLSFCLHFFFSVSVCQCEGGSHIILCDCALNNQAIILLVNSSS